MSLQSEAIFEDGVLKPLEPLELAEHQVPNLIVGVTVVVNPDIEAEAWRQVYSGLCKQDIDELTRIIESRE